MNVLNWTSLRTKILAGLTMVAGVMAAVLGEGTAPSEEEISILGQGLDTVVATVGGVFTVLSGIYDRLMLRVEELRGNKSGGSGPGVEGFTLVEFSLLTLIVALTATLLACASLPGSYKYDRSTYLGVAAASAGQGLTAELCASHTRAAEALRDPTGTAYAFHVVGKAPAIVAQARDHDESGTDCTLLVERGITDPDLVSRWLAADARLWTAGVGLVQ